MAEQPTTEASERQRNLELLRRGIASYNAGDLSFTVELAADDIEVYAHPGLINTGTYRGRDEFLRWMSNWNEAWSEVKLDIRDVQSIDDAFLLVEVFQTAVGAGSGVPVEMEIFQLIELADGEIRRFHLYPDRESALTALDPLRSARGT